MEPKSAEISPAAATESRISVLTLLFGWAAALLVAVLRDRRWGAGLAIGAALAWLNFRWLGRGLDALLTASTAQAEREKAVVPLGSYFVVALRYGLIAFAVYVIFEYLKVPVLSMVVGLCSLGAATIAASVYEILHPVD
jgi:small-conductance mechanosensitive channel